MGIPITIANFKTYFTRDFNYTTNITGIMDIDISKAINEADTYISKAIIPSTQLTMAYYYLAAHILVLNIREGFNGVQSVGQDIIQSNTVGISESYAVPSELVKNTILNFYAKTGYGRKYLSIIRPHIIGNVGIL